MLIFCINNTEFLSKAFKTNIYLFYILNTIVAYFCLSRLVKRQIIFSSRNLQELHMTKKCFLDLTG